MSNLGAYGVKNFAPIVRMPQACALALGAAEERVIPNEGEKTVSILGKGQTKPGQYGR